MTERGILERLHIVAKADKFGIGNQTELAHRQPDTLDKGPDKPNDKRNKHRTHKQNSPASCRLLQGICVGIFFAFHGITSMSYFHIG